MASGRSPATTGNREPRHISPPAPALTRCLKKDPKARLRDIGDARLQIEELLSGAPEEAGVAVEPRALSLWRRVLPWASTGALAIGLVLIATAVIALRRAAEVT